MLSFMAYLLTIQSVTDFPKVNKLFDATLLAIAGTQNMYISIYKFGLSVWVSVCLFVCLYPINVKTAEPIGPKFFVGHHVIPGKVYESKKV